MAARRAGQPQKAVDLLSRALRADPRNADIQLQIGLAELTLGQLEAAEAAFHRTLQLAPGYADARIGLSRIALRRGLHKAALAHLYPIGSGNAEADALHRQIETAKAQAPWRWRIDLDGSHTELDDGSEWTSAAAVLQHRPNAATTIAVTAERTRRFGGTDVYGEARLDYRFSASNSAYVFAGGAVEPQHRPRVQLGLGAASRLHGGRYATIVRLDLRHADYATGDVQTVTPGIEQYLAGRAWVTAQWINIWDGPTHSSGWLVRGDALPLESVRVFVGMADAPDLDTGRVRRTRSGFAGIALDLGNQLSARLSYAVDDPERSPTRRTAALGMGYRF
ncbi:MAG: YaiO family outer membrane beta-barrel protein [Sphingomicrobium sp.]